MKNNRTKNKFLKAIFSLLLLSCLLYLADPAKVFQSLSHVSITNFVILMILSFLMIGISAIKWQLFIEYLGAKVSLLRLFALYITGYFINILFPSYIGGDALRSYYVGKTVGQHQALSATFLERYTGLLAMALLGMIAALYENTLIDFGTRAIVVAVGVIVIAITFSAYSMRFDAEKYNNKIVKKLISNISRLHELMLQTSNQRLLWVKALGLSFTYHLFTVANTYIAGVAVGWHNPPIGQLFVVLPIILILGSIPITPSGLGIQEGAFFHFLQMLGATAPQALGVAVLLRAKTYILALIGWLVWSYIGGKEKLVAENLNHKEVY